jgi:hypothetical protein
LALPTPRDEDALSLQGIVEKQHTAAVQLTEINEGNLLMEDVAEVPEHGTRERFLRPIECRPISAAPG